MKKKLALLLSAIMLLAIVVIPAQAADTVYNLIDESGATWADTPANENTTTHSFTDGKLIVTAPGSWPYVVATLDEPLAFAESDNAKLNLKFTVEDSGAESSIRLISGTNNIWLHQFVAEAPINEGSGDIKAGTFELSIDLFDLKMVEGVVGTKDLVLVDGKLPIDGFQVWCSGSSSAITVTVEKFEIVVPGGSINEESEPATETKIVNLAKDKSYTKFGYYSDAEGNFPWPDVDDKELTNGAFATFADSSTYQDAAFVGFNIGAADMVAADNSRISEIVVDLGKVEKLTKFRVETLSNDVVGIRAPLSITVSVSDDKSTWTEVGALAYGDVDVATDVLFFASLEKAAQGRYVKFASEHDTNWVFISEVEVYGETTSTVTPPVTGEYGLVGFALVAAISLAGVVVISRKRA